jgi:hypothetical protein
MTTFDGHRKHLKSFLTIFCLLLAILIGVVTFENAPDSVDQLIDAADSQMYFAKSQGKNRIHYEIVAQKEDPRRTWPQANSASP